MAVHRWRRSYVEGDDVARAGSRSPDRVVGARDDNAGRAGKIAVAQGGRSRCVRADQVALDDVGGTGKAADVDSVIPVSRDQVPRARRRATDDVVNGVPGQIDSGSVSKG